MTLLQARQIVPDSVSDLALEELLQTIDSLLQHQRPDGNLPSVLGSLDDEVVQWCHGATGLLPLLLHGAKLAASQDRVCAYQHAAANCGHVCWSRGLSRKGLGLCHGLYYSEQVNQLVS